MSYATSQNMIDRFGEAELIDLTNPGGEDIDATRVSNALADADADIDGHLVGRYELPLTTVPPMLERLACDLARYFLYDEGAPEQISARYKQAMKTLENLATAKIRLPDTTGAEETQADEVVFNEGPDRVFSANTLKGF